MRHEEILVFKKTTILHLLQKRNKNRLLRMLCIQNFDEAYIGVLGFFVSIQGSE